MSGESGPGAPASALAGLTSAGDRFSVTPAAAARKWQRFLLALLDGPMTTRQLELAPVFDHCAHSTASELRKRGIEIETRIIEIVGYAGLPARVARYSLTPAGREAARWLMATR